MATILRTNGFAFRIHTNDHEPAHVHVVKGDGEVIINLGDETTHPSIREIYGLSDRDVAVAYDLVNQFKTTLLNGWRGIHERSNA